MIIFKDHQKNWRKENLNIKIVRILIATLLITTSLSGVIPAEENRIKVATNASNDTGKIITIGDEDILDQNNSECVTGSMLVDSASTWKYAQSFKPSLSILTRIEIYLDKQGNGGWRTYTADIRTTLNGSNLTSATKILYGLPYNSNWIEFDFPDISIVPGQTYYIVCTPDGNLWSHTYTTKWNYCEPDPYDRGEAWKFDDHWEKLEPDGTPSDFCFKTYGLNLPPNQPDKPNGPISGKAGNLYNYSASTEDPEGHKLCYFFDWDDGNNSGWIGPFNPGEICLASHVWEAGGNYSIKVKAKDEYDFESDWSEPLTITMPKNKSINTLFIKFLENHPRMFLILRKLLDL